MGTGNLPYNLGGCGSCLASLPGPNFLRSPRLPERSSCLSLRDNKECSPA
jgi:hypothetical protein